MAKKKPSYYELADYLAGDTDNPYNYDFGDEFNGDLFITDYGSTTTTDSQNREIGKIYSYYLNAFDGKTLKIKGAPNNQNVFDDRLIALLSLSEYLRRHPKSVESILNSFLLKKYNSLDIFFYFLTYKCGFINNGFFDVATIKIAVDQFPDKDYDICKYGTYEIHYIFNFDPEIIKESIDKNGVLDYKKYMALKNERHNWSIFKDKFKEDCKKYWKKFEDNYGYIRGMDKFISKHRSDIVSYILKYNSNTFYDYRDNDKSSYKEIKAIMESEFRVLIDIVDMSIVFKCNLPEF